MASPHDAVHISNTNILVLQDQHGRELCQLDAPIIARESDMSCSTSCPYSCVHVAQIKLGINMVV